MPLWKYLADPLSWKENCNEIEECVTGAGDNGGFRRDAIDIWRRRPDTITGFCMPVKFSPRTTKS
jgi:hypothetical protein